MTGIYLNDMHALISFITIIVAIAFYYIGNFIVHIMYWWTFKRKKNDNRKPKR